MALNLVFLGRLADVAGAGGMRLEVTVATTLAEVIAHLAPPLAEAVAKPNIRLALNGVLLAARDGVTLADGDELAFLPPVSGG